jgi:hypothetical protein
MAEDVRTDAKRAYVVSVLEKLIEDEAVEEENRQNQPPASKKSKTAKPRSRIGDHNVGLFLKALVDNAPTEEGRLFIIEDIYCCLKSCGDGTSVEAAQLEGEAPVEVGNRVKGRSRHQDEALEEAAQMDGEAPVEVGNHVQRPCTRDEIAALKELDAYYVTLLILPSMSPTLQYADFIVMAKMNPSRTDLHPARGNVLENIYYPEIESGSRAPQATLKTHVIPSFAVTDNASRWFEMVTSAR